MANLSPTLQRRLSISVGVTAVIVCSLAFALRTPATATASSPADFSSATDSQNVPLEPALRSLDGVTAHG